jgi:5'-3' exonuclease
MAVLPIESSHFIPEPYRKLMIDPNSPIKDFYPEEFKVDMNDKKNAWEGIVMIPFIDQDRLVKAMQSVDVKLLTQDVPNYIYLSCNCLIGGE